MLLVLFAFSVYAEDEKLLVVESAKELKGDYGQEDHLEEGWSGNDVYSGFGYHQTFLDRRDRSYSWTIQEVYG